MGRVYQFPIKGYSRNPLLDLPRNSACPCRSGRKFKVCCLPTLPMYIKTETAAAYKEQMSKPDLVFMTEENKEQLASEIAARQATCKHEWYSVNGHEVCKLCAVSAEEWKRAASELSKED